MADQSLSMLTWPRLPFQLIFGPPALAAAFLLFPSLPSASPARCVSTNNTLPLNFFARVRICLRGPAKPSCFELKLGSSELSSSSSTPTSPSENSTMPSSCLRCAMANRRCSQERLATSRSSNSLLRPASGRKWLLFAGRLTVANSTPPYSQWAFSA